MLLFCHACNSDMHQILYFKLGIGKLNSFNFTRLGIRQKSFKMDQCKNMTHLITRFNKMN